MQEGSEREKLLRAEQATAFGRWRAWTKCTRWAYDLGILGLLAALGLALPPLRGGGAQDTLRWVTSGLAFAACAGEAVWVLVASRRGLRRVMHKIRRVNGG